MNCAMASMASMCRPDMFRAYPMGKRSTLGSSVEPNSHVIFSTSERIHSRNVTAPANTFIEV
jgi:hypothetical protein